MTNVEPTLDDPTSRRKVTTEANERSEATQPCRREIAPVVVAIVADAARGADHYLRSYDAGCGAE